MKMTMTTRHMGLLIFHIVMTMSQVVSCVSFSPCSLIENRAFRLFLVIDAVLGDDGQPEIQFTVETECCPNHRPPPDLCPTTDGGSDDSRSERSGDRDRRHSAASLSYAALSGGSDDESDAGSNDAATNEDAIRRASFRDNLQRRLNYMAFHGHHGQLGTAENLLSDLPTPTQHRSEVVSRHARERELAFARAQSVSACLD